MSTETILLFIIIGLMAFYIISQRNKRDTILYAQPYNNWGWGGRGRRRGGWRGGWGGGHGGGWGGP